MEADQNEKLQWIVRKSQSLCTQNICCIKEKLFLTKLLGKNIIIKHA